MPECVAAHLQQSRISTFFRETTPGSTAFREEVRKRENGKGTKGKEKEERKDGGKRRKKGRRGQEKVGREALPKQKFTTTPLSTV